MTGASGFVGSVLRARLAASVDVVSFGAPDWASRLESCHLQDAVIFHLAARVHERGARGEDRFMADNCGKTQALARAAMREGARRLVFLSTLKVHGEESGARAFTPTDAPAPADAYARSKLEGERALAEIAADGGLEYTVVRAPLDYGAGARANLASLVRLADSPWPLPFASLDAPRSFVHVDDLAALLIACAEQPRAAGRTYIAAHREPFTAATLVGEMRAALGRPARLWPVAPRALEAVAALAGRRADARRLTRPLVGDPSAAERELGWTARVSLAQAVEELVREYRAGGTR